MSITVPTKEQGHVLTAITTQGERLRLCRPLNDWSVRGSTLLCQERIALPPSALPSGPRWTLGAAWTGSGDDFVCSFRSTPGNEDVVALVSSPALMLPPHQGTDMAISTFVPASANVGAIDAIAENSINAADVVVPNTTGELVAQLHKPARQIVVLTSDGVAVFCRLRPIDTLHCILLAPDHLRAGLLNRMSSVCSSPQEFCCLLLLAANGCADVPPPSIGAAGGHASRRFPFLGPGSRSSAVPPLAEETLGMRITTATSPDVCRIAFDAMRSTYSGHLVNDYQALGDQPFQYTITFCPLVQALGTVLARGLLPLWSRKLFARGVVDASPSATATAISTVSAVLRTLDSLKGDLWLELTHVRAGIVQTMWTQQEVHVGVATRPGFAPSLSPHDAPTLQALRLSQLHVVATRLHQLVTFLSLMKLVHPPAIESVLKDKAFDTKTFGDLARDFDKACDFSRRIMRAVGKVEREANLPRYEALQRFLALAQQRCPLLINATDVLEQRSLIDLDRCAKNLPTVGVAPRRLDSITAPLAGSAGLLHSSGGLDQICDMLLSIGQHARAIDMWLRAAAQADPNGIALDWYLGGGDVHTDLSGQRRLEVKRNLVGSATSALEQLYTRERAAFDVLLPTSPAHARAGGSIWSIEPDDRLAHCLIFDWLNAHRDDASIAEFLQLAFVMANSQFLDWYLQRNKGRLASALPIYFRRRTRDFQQAVAAYIALAHGPLNEVAPEQRLQSRMASLMSAVQCLQENGGDPSSVENLLEQLDVQLQMARVAHGYLQSDSADFTKAVEFEGRSCTQRDIAVEHLSRLQSTIVPPEALFQIASLYRSVGGIAVQMRILQVHRVNDPAVYTQVIDFAFNIGTSRQETARLLLGFYDAVVFPLAYVLSILEEEAYQLNPAGSTDTVDLLLREGTVPLDVVVDTLRGMCDALSGSADFIYSGYAASVTEAFAAHTLAYAVCKLCAAKKRQRGATHALGHILGVTSDIIDRAERVTMSRFGRDRSEMALAAEAALAAARRVLERCDIGGASLDDSRGGGRESSFADF